MIRTHAFACSLPREVADALNHESGRIYARVLVTHYRVYRQSGAWLSKFGAKRLDDYYSAAEPRVLHAHSIDAAQEAFYAACQTAKANGPWGAHYPHRRPRFRPTVWKSTGIRRKTDSLLLSRARGLAPLRVRLPSHLRDLLAGSFVEMRLVYDRVGQRYEWHLVVDDGREPSDAPGPNVAALDLGEVHPVTATDGRETVVFSARALRSVKQYGHKRRAELQHLQARKKKGSRQWRRLQRRMTRFAAQQKRRVRDIEHKVSRAVVNWAVERAVGTLAIGDVRDVADGVDKGARANQKISNWSYGRLRQYLTYKAEAAGMAVELVDEAYSTQTCPNCGERHKPRGRRYRCPACGFVSHRDAVGAANILSRHTHGVVGRVRPPRDTKYRHPFNRRGKRTRMDTAHVAWAESLPPATSGLRAMAEGRHRQSQEAAGLPQRGPTLALAPRASVG